MKIIKVAIVEDNDAESAVLQDAIARYGEEKKVQFAVERFKSAEPFLEKNSFDLDIVFMDIELPDGMDGMRAAKKFRKLNGIALLIFVTNMKKYAVNGYEVGALNYILKPLKYYSFAMTMDRALRSINEKRSAPVRFRTENGYKAMDCCDIYYIEIMKHDLIFHTVDGEFYNYGTLNEWEKKLTPYNFVRCSSSTLVNLRHITEIRADEIVIAGDAIRLGRSKKKVFMQSLAKFFGETV
jgi:DNA-binding LytR/AlgR family response regulator